MSKEWITLLLNYAYIVIMFIVGYYLGKRGWR
jgi:hypothetical protein